MKRAPFSYFCPNSALIPLRIVWRLFADRNIVRVTFDKSRIGNSHKLGICTQRLDILFSAISHARTKAAFHLVDNLRDASAIRDAPLDAFGNELAGIFLEISILASRRHSRERTHAAIYLKASALIQFDFAGAFQRTRKQGTYHNRTAPPPQSP